MIDEKRVLGIIPARGGSKGVPRKNVRKVGGKPLIAWTIEEGKKSKYIDRLILSSDDEEIIRIAESWGCEAPFVRPAQFAQDETPGIDPVLHAINVLPGYEIVVLLQATSPLRNVVDIDGCLDQCVACGANACVSVTEAEQSPYWMYFLDKNGRMESVLSDRFNSARRQELPSAYALNGAVYVAKTAWLQETRTFVTSDTVAYVMPRARSLDIDTELDFRILEELTEDMKA